MRRKYRLRANADFQRLRREGRALVHPLLVVLTLPNGLEYSRFGFAVGRQLGKAVERNRLKRRMREVVRVKIQNSEIVAGWDVVFIARRSARGVPFRQVGEAIGLLLARAGLVGEVS